MTHKLNEAAMLTPAELIEALEAEMYFPDPSSDAVINAATAISLARKLAPVEVDDETIEATCQLLCRHFENLKRAESDGGGELWYGELERIVRKEIRPTTAGWQDISTAPKDGTWVQLAAERKLGDEMAEALKNMLQYIDQDNLTMQSKHRQWNEILAHYSEERGV